MADTESGIMVSVLRELTSTVSTRKELQRAQNSRTPCANTQTMEATTSQREEDQRRLHWLVQPPEMEETSKVVDGVNDRWVPRPGQLQILCSPCQWAPVKGATSPIPGQHTPLHFFFCLPEAKMLRFPLLCLNENILVYKLSLYN